MPLVYLRTVDPPTDYVLWDGTNLDEVVEYVDPHRTNWKPIADGDVLVLTGSKPSPLSPAPTYNIPSNSYYIHAQNIGATAPVLTLLPAALVGWSYERTDEAAAPADESPMTLTF